MEQKKHSIVVVNDEILQLRLISSVLEKDGFRVIPCSSAEQALALLGETAERPDVIVADLHMPGMDGWRFCSLLRSPVYEAFNKVPILVVSAIFSGEHVEQITAELGANAFLPVPFDAAELRSHVRALLHGESHHHAREVLIVDDSRSMNSLLQDAFQQRGYRTCGALNGTEGMQLFLERAPEVAIVDYRLPDGNGLELIQKFRRFSSSAVIVMITTDTDTGLATRVMGAGADGHVLKPFDPQYLISLCETAQRSHSILQIQDRLDERTRELQKSERWSGLLFEKMLDGFAYHEIICAPDGRPADYRFLQVNPAFERLTGLAGEKVIGRLASEVLPKQTPGWLERFANVALTGRPVHFEEYSVALDRYIEVNAYCPRYGHFAMTFDDVTKRKVAEREVERLAYYNPLTGLPNRQLMYARLEQKLAEPQGSEGIGVFCVDLDRFRVINDSLGYQSGDILIRNVALRLLQVAGEGGTVGHTCGDEFVIIRGDIPDKEEALRYAADIRAILAEPFTIQGRDIYLSASIGITFGTAAGGGAEGLLRNANMAMYRAKDAGRSCCRVFTPSIHQESEERLAMEQSLRCAIDRQELFLHYQPILDVRTGAISGLEALLRWDHPQLGLVPPARFIPIAEDTGLIIPLGEWVLRTACTELVRLHRAGHSHLRMAVNLSGRQLHHAGLVESITSIIRETGIEPSLLELELTESSIMEDAERTVTTLRILQQMGISLAVDDFGTGYSSLSYLKRFPLTRLKIDRSFIHELPKNSEDAAIVMAIIAMARALRLRVTGEGIETEEQLKLLGQLGCDDMQGFFIARPASSCDLAQLLSVVPMRCGCLDDNCHTLSRAAG